MSTYELARYGAYRALEYAAARGYEGPDMYDGLASPLARCLKRKLARQALLQVAKRCNTTGRKLLRIPGGQMAKALALFCEGATTLGDTDTANEIANELLNRFGDGPWGYEFDVQTRWGFYAAGTPNAIVTSFVIRALDGLGRRSDISNRTATWLQELRTSNGYFRYTSTSPALIHNANVLVASSIARLTSDREVIARAVERTLDSQRADGSWPYGEGIGLGWTDNFHTVYVLEALQHLRQTNDDVNEVCDRGKHYWLNQLFDVDGEPLYFPRGRHRQPIDIHNISSALSGLLNLGYHNAQPHLGATLSALLRHQHRDGGFRTGRGPVYMRWNQGHAFLALAKLAARSTE